MLKFIRAKFLLSDLLFQLLIFLLPIQLGYHSWPDWAFVYGVRVDYLSPIVYLTDIVLVILLTVWLYESLKEIKIDKKINIAIFILLFMVVNIALSKFKEPAIFKWAKFTEFAFFALYVSSKKLERTIRLMLKPLALSLILVSLIGLIQFIQQRTIGGVFYYLGERDFSATTPGIALFSFLGREYLRPYSTFSHPNSLAGFVSVAFLILFSRKQKERVWEFLRIGTLIFGGTILVLSFSKSVWLGLFVVGLLFFVLKRKRSLFLKLAYLIFWGVVVASLLTPVFSKIYLSQKLDLSEAVENRLVLARASGQMLAERPLIGIGFNNFIPNLPTKDSESTIWFLQPVHNIFLLTLTELGVIGLMGLVYILWKGVFISGVLDRERRITIFTITLITLTGFLDHYWLTLQQNQLLLSLIVGLSFVKKR